MKTTRQKLVEAMSFLDSYAEDHWDECAETTDKLCELIRSKDYLSHEFYKSLEKEVIEQANAHIMAVRARENIA